MMLSLDLLKVKLKIRISNLYFCAIMADLVME